MGKLLVWFLWAMVRLAFAVNATPHNAAALVMVEMYSVTPFGFILRASGGSQ